MEFGRGGYGGHGNKYTYSLYVHHTKLIETGSHILCVCEKVVGYI